MPADRPSSPSSPGGTSSPSGCTKHDVQTSHPAMTSPRRRSEMLQRRRERAESLGLVERRERRNRRSTPLSSLSKRRRRRSVSLGDYDDDDEDEDGDGRDDDNDHGRDLSKSSERYDGVKASKKEAGGGDDDSTRIRQSRDADEGGGQQADDVQKESVPISIMYGLINIAIVLPVIMSFGTIIYSDPEFAPYLPVLVKLTVISGAVHQLCFTTFSTLPFAVGQVQDAGLIFLSAMAHRIVTYCRERPEDDRDVVDDDIDARILATTTILLPMCTAILGLSLIAIGRANLARWVQMLPTPVVGGYLAYIGFFCGQSGLALMANVDVRSLAEWGKFANTDAFVHLLPGLVGGVAIYVVVRKVRQMFVLPACIAALIVAFYVGLRVAGSTVDDARRNGWVNQSDEPPPWYQTWEYLRFDKVEWGVFPHLIVTLVSMILVVALSSCLDVAAIELELRRPLDYDHELRTVGLSNVVSGLTGGYTGSYIFSQSIFSLRAGIRTRVCGLVIAACEIVAVILPFSVLSYVPNYFFGSLLVMICVDLVNEWLWDARKKMTGTEYAIDLSSFCLIQVLGVEYGILAGLLLYVVCRKMGMNVGDVDDDEDEVVEIMEQDVDATLGEREAEPLAPPGYGSLDKSGDESSNWDVGLNGHGHDPESDADGFNGRSNGHATPTEKTHLI